ncbi:MAG: hypothetical protein Q4F65_05060 [Propionibacteriaceae bacterium]|nr:hypothetical protein [Propionibacteriaceae bacterium]
MSGFHLSSDHSGDAWFRVGRLDVTTTVLVVLAGAVGLVLSAFVPALLAGGAFIPVEVLRGEVWRVVTWPLVSGVSLWSVLTLVLLWFFGRDLESQIGRRPMASLYVGLWATLTVVNFLVGLLLGGGALAGLDAIQFIILLLWIAENPRRPFFFGIPAWVVGAVLVAIQVLGYIANRSLAGLASLIITAFVAALLARRFGLLSDLSWLPGGRPRAKAASGHRRPSAAPRPAARVSRSQQKAAQRQASDAERMDALLEKISAQGIHSLTPGERKELEALRERRRKR